MYISNKIGLFSWIATCLYFLIEPFFIFTSTAPYNYLHHAMSLSRCNNLWRIHLRNSSL